MQSLTYKLARLRKTAKSLFLKKTRSHMQEVSSPLKPVINSRNEYNTTNHNGKLIKSSTNTQSRHNTKRDILIIWFEPTFFVRNDFQQVFDKLNMECDKVDVFTKMDACVNSLTKTTSNSKVYLLVPGLWANNIFKYLQFSSASKTPIDTMFIYSSSPQQYEFLREQSLYTVKIFTSIDDIWNVIHPCRNKQCETLRFYDQRTVRDLSFDDTIAAFTWFIAFKDALFVLPRDEKAKYDMLDVCCRFYSHNNAQLALIDEFKHTYRSEDAPKWFSCSSFLYMLINRALRTQDVEQLYVFRYFIRDLSLWLSHEFNKTVRRNDKFFLYRGAALSQDDIQSLDRGKLFAPNGFFSTSRNMAVAILFINSSRSDTVGVLYKIKCDMTCYSDEEISELVAFADISENSLIPDEEEILFDLGATFEIEDIEQPSSENNYFIIEMIPSCEGTHILHSYRQSCRSELESSSAALMFGVLLIKTDKYATAQHYFEQLLNNPGDENVSDIHYYLGWTHMRQEDYGRATINFERAHDLIPKSDAISRARILNSIGKALIEKGFIKESLSYYERALHLRISYPNFKHEDVADSYSNVARVHNLAGNYKLALKYYEKSVKINTNAAELDNHVNNRANTEETNSMKCSGSSSSDSLNEVRHSSMCDRLSNSLYEMGALQCKIGASTSGLHNMKQSLSLSKYSIAHSTPDLHGNFHSLSNVASIVTSDTREIEYCLQCFENAKRRPSKTRTEIMNALESVGSAYTADGRFKEALPYFLWALREREEQEKKQQCSLELARIVNFVGDTYYGLDQFKDALISYRRAIAIYEKFPSTSNRDRLRTLNKIDKINQEISLKTRTANTRVTSRNRSISTRSLRDKHTK